mmetsp:Transcript_28760/g.69682  ORF Transcript_28760/g.69682 Transcript_28760/m.69682 type:complete len:99 (-) Transcript_28760:163-459(-)
MRTFHNAQLYDASFYYIYRTQRNRSMKMKKKKKKKKELIHGICTIDGTNQTNLCMRVSDERQAHFEVKHLWILYISIISFIIQRIDDLVHFGHVVYML